MNEPDQIAERELSEWLAGRLDKEKLSALAKRLYDRMEAEWEAERQEN